MSTQRAASAATFMLFSRVDHRCGSGLLHSQMSRPSVHGIQVAFSNLPKEETLMRLLTFFHIPRRYSDNLACKNTCRNKTAESRPTVR